MNLSSPWTHGVISSLAAFVLAYSIESFRSLPLFWIFYVGMGATWLALAVIVTTRKAGTRSWIPPALLILGIISITINFFPLALALFVVYINTIMLIPANRGWRVFEDALECIVYVVLAFVLFLVSGFIPLIVVPVAYIIAGVALIASVKRTETGISVDWLGTLSGTALLSILVVFNESYASVGAAAAAAGVAVLIYFGRTARSTRRRASQRSESSLQSPR